MKPYPRHPVKAPEVMNDVRFVRFFLGVQKSTPRNLQELGPGYLLRGGTDTVGNWLYM